MTDTPHSYTAASRNDRDRVLSVLDDLHIPYTVIAEQTTSPQFTLDDPVPVWTITLLDRTTVAAITTGAPA